MITVAASTPAVPGPPNHLPVPAEECYIIRRGVPYTSAVPYLPTHMSVPAKECYIACNEVPYTSVPGLPTHVSVPAKECYITRNGVPSWEVMKALRLACLGSRQRKSCGYLAAAGQPCSTESEIQVETPLHPSPPPPIPTYPRQVQAMQFVWICACHPVALEL